MSDHLFAKAYARVYSQEYMAASIDNGLVLPQCTTCGDRISLFDSESGEPEHPGPTCEQCYRVKSRAAKRVRRAMLRADYRERARNGR